jgi:hypothetical protein
MKLADEQTYYNFSILEKINNIVLTDHNLIDDYIDTFIPFCKTVDLSDEEFKKYKYCPDLLAYDVYGSTQLDFVILAINNMIDPREFTQKRIILPMSSVLSAFLSDVKNTNSGYISQNRIDNGLVTY